MAKKKTRAKVRKARPKGKRGPAPLVEVRGPLVIEALRRGNYVNVAAKLAGISITSVYEWLAKGNDLRETDPENPYAVFAAGMEKAEAEAEEDALKVIQEAASGWVETRHEETVDPDGLTVKDVTITKRDWRAAATFLERRHSQRWGPKQEVQHEGEIRIKRYKFDGADPLSDPKPEG